MGSSAAASAIASSAASGMISCGSPRLGSASGGRFCSSIQEGQRMAADARKVENTYSYTLIPIQRDL